MDICEWCGNWIDPEDASTANDPDTFCSDVCEAAWEVDNNG
jgi:hypothetical protein